MSDAISSIEQLLGLARQHRLWPEVEPVSAESHRPVKEASGHSTAGEIELALATEALVQQTARALGPRLAAAQPLLDLLLALLADGRRASLDAAWVNLDELEDQLEALSR